MIFISILKFAPCKLINFVLFIDTDFNTDRPAHDRTTWVESCDYHLQNTATVIGAQTTKGNF